MKYTTSVSSAFWMILATVLGGVAGGVSGYTTARLYPAMTAVEMPPQATSTQIPQSTTTFSILPLDRKFATTLVLPHALSLRVTPSATLFRKPKGGTLEDRFLTEDRMLGQAIALTSDGWFVSSARLVEGLRLTELVLWQDHQAYAIKRGMIDHLNQTVYFKTDATNLTPSAFGHIGELVIGAEVWTETRPGEYAPSSVLNVSMRATPQDAVSSEISARRITIHGLAQVHDAGGAVWDPNGSLLGVIESKPGEVLRIIPASSIAASFTSLLTSGEIRHALLGVRTMDARSLRVDGSRTGIPETGAWIHEEKKTALPGIVHDSPAAKAKLKIGDVILRVERDILDGTADLGEILSDYRPGTTVTLRVLRDGQDSDVQVALGSVVTGEALK